LPALRISVQYSLYSRSMRFEPRTTWPVSPRTTKSLPVPQIRIVTAS
jgi:hypothetical protein